MERELDSLFLIMIEECHYIKFLFSDIFKIRTYSLKRKYYLTEVCALQFNYLKHQREYEESL